MQEKTITMPLSEYNQLKTQAEQLSKYIENNTVFSYKKYCYTPYSQYSQYIGNIELNEHKGESEAIKELTEIYNSKFEILNNEFKDTLKEQEETINRLSNRSLINRIFNNLE
jgi:hypothetical protein